MKLTIDGVGYYLNLGGMSHSFRAIYDANKNMPLKVKAGKVTLDFGPKSALRQGLKALLAPIAIPILTHMFESKGYYLTPPKRTTKEREDLIDYLVVHVLELIELEEKDVHLYASSVQDTESDYRNIKTVSTTSNRLDSNTGRGDPDCGCEETIHKEEAPRG